MPIEVKVVSQADFDAWVASKAPQTAAARQQFHRSGDRAERRPGERRRPPRPAKR